MKHLLRSSGFRTLLLASGLFAITLPLLNSCNSTSKATGSSGSMKTAHSLTDTATMSNIDTGGGKQTSTGKDKPPRK